MLFAAGGGLPAMISRAKSRKEPRPPKKERGGRKKSPAQAGLLRACFRSRRLFRELGDLMRQARNFSARRILMNYISLRRLHELGFGACHRLERAAAIAALDRLLDRPHRTAHLGPARFVDDGAAGNLARRLLGGSRIGHILKCPLAVTDHGRALKLSPRFA